MDHITDSLSNFRSAVPGERDHDPLAHLPASKLVGWLRGEWLAWFVMVLLAAATVAFLLRGAAEAGRVYLQIQGDAALRDGGWGAYRRFVHEIDFWLNATGWPALFAFAFWLYLAAHNARLLQARGLACSPDWVLGLFFIPCINLPFVYLNLQQIWQASDPDKIDTPSSWRRASPSWLARLWGLNAVSGPLLIVLCFRIDALSRDYANIVVAMCCVANLNIAFACLLPIPIMRAIIKRQRARFIHLYEDPDRSAPYEKTQEGHESEDGGFEDDIPPISPRQLHDRRNVNLAMLALALCVLAIGAALLVPLARINLIHESRQRQVAIPGFGDPRFERRNPIGDELKARWDDLDRYQAYAFLLLNATCWPATFFFLKWLAGACRNLRMLQAERRWNTEGVPGASFFIPLVNLVRPYCVIQELWCASGPLAVASPCTWAKARKSWLVRFWWFSALSFLMASSTLLLFEYHTSRLCGGDSTNDYLMSSKLACLQFMLAIVTGVSLIFIIRGITRRQEQRHVRLYEES